MKARAHRARNELINVRRVPHDEAVCSCRLAEFFRGGIFRDSSRCSVLEVRPIIRTQILLLLRFACFAKIIRLFSSFQAARAAGALRRVNLSTLAILRRRFLFRLIMIPTHAKLFVLNIAAPALRALNAESVVFVNLQLAPPRFYTRCPGNTSLSSVSGARSKCVASIRGLSDARIVPATELGIPNN